MDDRGKPYGVLLREGGYEQSVNWHETIEEAIADYQEKISYLAEEEVTLIKRLTVKISIAVEDDD